MSQFDQHTPDSDDENTRLRDIATFYQKEAFNLSVTYLKRLGFKDAKQFLLYDLRNGKTIVSHPKTIMSVESALPMILSKSKIKPPFHMKIRKFNGLDLLILVDNIEEEQRLLFIQVEGTNQHDPFVYRKASLNEETSTLRGLLETKFFPDLKIKLCRRIRPGSHGQLNDDETLSEEIICYVCKKIECVLRYNQDDSRQTLYKLKCFSYESIKDLREHFKKQFSKDIDAVLDTHELWLMKNGTILNDTVIYTGVELQLEIQPIHLFPITIMRKVNRHLMGINGPISVFVDPDWSTSMLRKEISRKVNQPANSLSLSVGKIRLEEVTCISNLVILTPNCKVFWYNENPFHLQVTCPIYGTYTIQVFGLDSGFDIKNKITKVLSEKPIDPTFIRIYHWQHEMSNGDILAKTDIVPGSCVKFVICPQAMMLTVRQAGVGRTSYVVYNPRECHLSSLKSQIISDSSDINLFHNGKVLPDHETLADLGLINGDELVVTRAPESLTGSSRIKIEFIASESGRTESRYLIEENGIRFYAMEFNQRTMKTLKERNPQAFEKVEPEIVKVKYDSSKMTRRGHTLVFDKEGQGMARDEGTSLMLPVRQQLDMGLHSDTRINMHEITQKCETTTRSFEAELPRHSMDEHDGEVKENSLVPTTRPEGHGLEQQPSIQSSSTKVQKTDSVRAEKLSFQESIDQRDRNNSAACVESSKSLVAVTSNETHGSDERKLVLQSEIDAKGNDMSSCARKLTKRRIHETLMYVQGNETLIQKIDKCEQLVSNDEAADIFDGRMFCSSSQDESRGSLSIIPFKKSKHNVGDKVLHYVGSALGNEWQDFAIRHLDTEFSEVQSCEMETKSVSMQAYKTLKKWRDRLGQTATISLLKNHLSEFGKQIIADAVDEIEGYSETTDG